MAADEGERTEEPTGKRIEDARKDGNVPKSQDVSSWVTLLVSLPAVIFLFYFASENVLKLFHYYMALIGTPLTKEKLFEIIAITGQYLALATIPIMFPIMLAGIISNVVQFGFNFTTKPLSFDRGIDLALYSNYSYSKNSGTFSCWPNNLCNCIFD